MNQTGRSNTRNQTQPKRDTMMKQKEVKDSTQKRNIDQQEETRLRPKKDTLMKQKTKRPTRRDVAADRKALLLNGVDRSRAQV